MSIISNEHQTGSPFDATSSHTVQGSTIVDGIGVRWVVFRDSDTMQAFVSIGTSLDHNEHRAHLNQVQQFDLESSARHVAEGLARTLSKAFALGRKSKARELQAFLDEGKR